MLTKQLQEPLYNPGFTPVAIPERYPLTSTISNQRSLPYSEIAKFRFTFNLQASNPKTVTNNPFSDCTGHRLGTANLQDSDEGHSGREQNSASNFTGERESETAGEKKTQREKERNRTRVLSRKLQKINNDKI